MRLYQKNNSTVKFKVQIYILYPCLQEHENSHFCTCTYAGTNYNEKKLEMMNNDGIFENFSWYTKKRDEYRGFYRKTVLKALLLMPYSDMNTLIYKMLQRKLQIYF